MFRSDRPCRYSVPTGSGIAIANFAAHFESAGQISGCNITPSRICCAGFLMEENGFPVAPAILGIVLGPMLEGNFFNSMIKANGNVLAFFERPIAGALGVATIAIWIAMLWFIRRDTAASGPASPAGVR
jgi:TctA family transporter